MLSLLSGLGQGYNYGTQRRLDNERRARMDQIALDRAAREGTEFSQGQADRAELRAAGAPVAAEPDMVTDATGATMQRMLKPDTMDNADVGQPGEAPVTTGAMRVGMQGMLSPDQANAESAKQNSPDGTLARQQAALQRQNPRAGMQMQAEHRAAKLSEQQLREAVTKLQDNGTARALSLALAGAAPDQVKAAFNAQGDMKIADLQIQPFETNHPVLGKTMSARITGTMADGAPVDIPDATAMQFGLFSAEKQLAEKDRREQAAAAQKNQTRMLDIQQQNADTNSAYKDQAGAAMTMRAAGGGSGAGTKAAQFDEKQWDAAYKIEPSFVSFGDDMGGKPVESPELRLTYRSELNAARAAGSSSPSDAAESARTTTLMLKNKASDMVAAARAAGDSKLTEAQAVRNILKAYQQSQKQPAGVAPPRPAPPVTTMQSAAAAQAAPPIAPVAPAGFKPQTTGDATLNTIEAQNLASMKPLNDAVVTAQAQLAATAKSGDPAALQKYATALTQARAARDAAARQKFGNRAGQYLASVGD